MRPSECRREDIYRGPLGRAAPLIAPKRTCLAFPIFNYVTAGRVCWGAAGGAWRAIRLTLLSCVTVACLVVWSTPSRLSVLCLVDLVDAVLHGLQAARRDVEECLEGPLVRGPDGEAP